jgi:hypothetical protein
MAPAERAILLKLDPVGIVLLVLFTGVVPALALRASQGNQLAHKNRPSAYETRPIIAF